MLQLHDSLSKTKKPIEPLVPGTVTMYSCGPTVYGDVHIGNMRSFIAADLLRRYLEHKGFTVRQVMNITDVGHMLADADEGEDKMEAAAKKEGRSPEEIAAFYTERFFRDIDRLGLLRAEAYPRASAHVAEMISIIQKLLDAGKAYKVGGNVYYDVSTFPAYGKLSGNAVAGLKPGARVEVREEKKHPQDFALWIHNPAHQMQWEAPWGRGYPGWHIECSAMSMQYLGETIDLHTGGEDNKFPHHECEIAQSEGSTGKPFVRTWMHVTHLLVNGEKMSKSKGNFYTLDDLLAKGYAARDIRFALLSTHYRQQLNFTLGGIDAARAVLARFDDLVDLLHEGPASGGGLSFLQRLFSRSALVAKAQAAFEDAMDDDLNVSEALAVLFSMLRALNERHAAGTLSKADRAAATDFLHRISEVVGIRFGKAVAEKDIPAEVRALIEQRDAARAKKDYKESDRLRDALKEKGFIVEDTPEGRRLKRI